jgi:hypothetical protein
VLSEAVAAGRLPLEYAQQFVPQLEAPAPAVTELLAGAVKRIEA